MSFPLSLSLYFLACPRFFPLSLSSIYLSLTLSSHFSVFLSPIYIYLSLSLSIQILQYHSLFLLYAHIFQFSSFYLYLSIYQDFVVPTLFAVPHLSYFIFTFSWLLSLSFFSRLQLRNDGHEKDHFDFDELRNSQDSIHVGVKHTNLQHRLTFSEQSRRKEQFFFYVLSSFRHFCRSYSFLFSLLFALSLSLSLFRSVSLSCFLILFYFLFLSFSLLWIRLSFCFLSMSPRSHFLSLFSLSRTFFFFFASLSNSTL